jgi:hypothetical protein
MLQTLQLIQRSLPFTKLVVTVSGNSELVVDHSGLFRSTRINFPLERIAPSPIHVRNISVQWSVVTVIAFLLCVGAVMGGWATQGAGELFGLLFMLGIFIACLLNTLQLSSNLYHFKDAVVGGILFTVYRSKPSTMAVDNFVDELRKRIESFRTPVGVTPQETVALFKRHLDYLLENDVLLSTEYDAIAKRLDESVSKKKIVELVR